MAGLEQQGVEIGNLPGIQFDQFAGMIQAAVFGLGAAIVPKYLVRNELRQGRLVALGGPEPSVIGSYFLFWPDKSRHNPALAAFKAWIARAVETPAITR